MRSIALSTLVLCLTTPAFAQQAEPVDPPPQQVFVDEEGNEYVEDSSYEQEPYGEPDGYADDGTAYQGEYVEEGAYQDPNQPVGDPAQPQRPGRQVSLMLDVPIFLTNAQDIRPGVGVRGRFGWELGYIVPQVQVGVATNFLSEDAEDRLLTANLNQFWVTLGARLQILNRSRFVPVVDAGLRLQFWSRNFDDGFGPVTETVFEPGITVGAGLAIEITESFGLEVAADATLTFPTSGLFDALPSDGVQFFLMPRIGGTIYF